MNQGAWLKAEIARRKHTVASFSQASGIHKDTLYEWFKQERLAGRDDLIWSALETLGYRAEMEKLATVNPGVSVIQLVDLHFVPAGVRGKPRSSGGISNVESRMEEGIAEIPLFDLSVAAGSFADVSEVAEIVGIDSIRQGLFRVRVSGDSMLPKYKSGVIVEFEIVRSEIEQSHVGRNVYVQLDDGLATFKQLEDFDGDEIYLRALNRKKYPMRMVIERSSVVRMAIARGTFVPD